MPSSPLGRAFAAILVDMDGTILTSVAAAERAWSAWAVSRGIEPATFLPSIHGVQAVETIRRLGRPDLDPVTEAAAVTELEIADVGGVESIAGAVSFLRAVPLNQWALVTSAPRSLALRRMEAAGFPVPPVMITADDVARSKPAPDGFLLAAARLGVSAADCVIFEDSSAGVAAAEATGGTVIVITAGHQRPMVTPHTAVHSFSGLHAMVAEGGFLRIGIA
jgi:mannitol-1-/sugar-/sorbitol-6-phosphatase